MKMNQEAREKDLKAIKDISPESYRQVIDKGLRGQMSDEELHLTAVRMKIWERKVREE